MDRRRRGLAACVTSAVVAEVLGMKLPTVALNVWEKNPVAERVYEVGCQSHLYGPDPSVHLSLGSTQGETVTDGHSEMAVS